MALPQNHAQPMLSSDLRFAQDRLVLPGSGGARVGFRNFGNSLLATILRNPDPHQRPTRNPGVSRLLSTDMCTKASPWPTSTAQERPRPFRRGVFGRGDARDERDRTWERDPAAVCLASLSDPRSMTEIASCLTHCKVVGTLPSQHTLTMMDCP
jgi:hypothetical protein